MEVSPLQSLKVLCPINFTPFGISIDVSPVQSSKTPLSKPSKILLPIESILSGRVTLVRPVHL